MTNLGRLWVLVSLPLVSAVACGSDDGGSDGNAEDSSSSSGGGDDSGTGASATASTTASTSASTTASTSASTGPGEESSGGSEESSSADGSSSGTTGASVPAVVETTPADGAVGVFADTSLVVRFSEAMDADSVLAAYQSDDVPVDAVTVTWNDTAVEAPGGMTPPTVAFAAVPSRHTTALVAMANSQRSSPGTSVWGAPNTAMVPGTKETSGGRVSCSTVRKDPSLPVLFTVML